MTYRKGEMTKGAVDRNYPHQLELRADVTMGKNFDLANKFCRRLSLSPRGHCRRRNDVDYNIWCFADPAHANAFQARFGGERLTAKARKPTK
jgi:hypothetical protein